MEGSSNRNLELDKDELMKPGGDGQPINTSVLYDQDEHISSDVWNGKERGPLICNEHTRLLESWVLTSQQIKLVEKAGFGHLRLIPATILDAPLISALVERWRRETNTFHMSVGEMTVTLEDVAYLLGLSIDGKPVTHVNQFPSLPDTLYLNYLGRVPPRGSRTGALVKLKWLKDEFGKCPELASVKEIEFHTRAYLLFLLGTTIFSTNTGIHPMYLPLFGDFEKAGDYAWGAAALSFLYRSLGNASLISTTNIYGCLSMLQCWSYYHLSIGHPEFYTRKLFPLVVRWKNRRKHGAQRLTSKLDNLCSYRKALDSLTLKDVSWRPYAREDLPGIINTQVESGLGRSRTMLVCFHIAEWHLPDRCTRQFGMPQRIPKHVGRPSKKRGRDDKMESDEVEKYWGARHSLIVKAADDGNVVVDENEYMNWYFTITRRLIAPPQNINATDQPHTSDNILAFEEADWTVQDIFSELDKNNSNHHPSL